MLKLALTANVVLEKIRNRIIQASQNKGEISKSSAIVQGLASFQNQLLESLRRSRDEKQGPSPAPDSLFLAFPEKLFSKWSYLTFGSHRSDGLSSKDTHIDISATEMESWKFWDILGRNTRFSNFTRNNPKTAYVAHGLSPISDSCLLLADLGRAARASTALRVPLQVLLADVSWMSHNRSIRRFDIPDDQLEKGLHLCLGRRQQLYEALDFECKVHQILPFAKKGAIHSEKIKLIAERYKELGELVWGSTLSSTEQPLDEAYLTRISKPLHQSLDTQSPLNVLSRYPGVLQSIDASLHPHLEVIRTIAKRFRIVNEETFSYYFAQYYAQDEYRTHAVKIAPISERDFDEPFDELDASFRSWGKGDNPNLSSSSTHKQKVTPRLTVIYLPQYQIGKWQLLPYTPLSIDSLSLAEGKIETVEQNIILLSDCKSESVIKVANLLKSTREKNVLQLNRLLYDIFTLLVYYCRKDGLATVNSSVKALKFKSFEQLIKQLDPLLYESFLIEIEKESNWPDLWMTWLNSITNKESLQYFPSHLLIATRTIEEWTDDQINTASEILVLINKVFTSLMT